MDQRTRVLVHHAVVSQHYRLGLNTHHHPHPGMYNFHIQFTLGYEGALKWFPTFDIFQLGLNLAPLLFIVVIRMLLQAGSDKPIQI